MTASAANKQMTLTRVFDASPAEVWDAWTTPEAFSYWFGGSQMTVPLSSIALDVRPGGAWKATMTPANGPAMPFMGTYLEVIKPERLVMTFMNVNQPTDPNIETLTVTLKALSGKTEVTLHQAGFMPEEQYPKLVEGYGTFMDAMAELLDM